MFHILFLNLQGVAADIDGASINASRTLHFVELGFLNCVLERFGIKQGFRKWIQILFSKHRATALMNRDIFYPFFLIDE